MAFVLALAVVPGLTAGPPPGDQETPELPGHQVLSAESHETVAHLDGSALSLPWATPFAGILLSIAIFPLLAPHFWHRHYGKITALWAMALILPLAMKFGFTTVTYELTHMALLEYFPFIILLLALFTIAGGVRLTGSLQGSPPLNLTFLIVGTLLASWMGTTGAAMLLIRPIIRANKWRKRKVHVIIFFIFLVANIGGSLTPLGDPPLFLGFLHGVDFFWTTVAMFKPMMTAVLILWILFYVIDSFYFKQEVQPPSARENVSSEKFGIEGGVNLLLLLGVIGSVLLSGLWEPGVSLTVYHVEVFLQDLIRDILLLVLVFVSLKVTATGIRQRNDFTWFPIVEVAKLFAGIFVTIIPAIAILRAGEHGALRSVIGAVSTPEGNPVNATYFWATGLLSSFLDNAPTYLVFFNTAGGDADVLMHQFPQTLLAISAGAVFMGANTYVGNAPNFMVRSIASEMDISMPSFFGYMLKYSLPILIPIFVFVTWVFFL